LLSGFLWGAAFLYGQSVDSSCISLTGKSRVEGVSMSGWLEPNSMVFLHYGFYQCNPLRRGDYVVFKNGFNPLPILKKIAAIPGDVFSLGTLPNQMFCLIVNGDTVKVPSGSPLPITEKRSHMLRYYATSFGSVLPLKTCLVVGSGADMHDSTLFGPIGLADILGKAVPIIAKKTGKRKARKQN
jgi:type IV secretory pathway protease TraF